MAWFREARPPFTDEVIKAAVEHAAQEAPKEAVGAVAGSAKAGFEYVPLINTSARPESEFEIDTAAFWSLNPAGLVHSHPDGALSANSVDMENQQNTKLPWLVVSPKGALFTLGMEPPPLFDDQGKHIPRDFCWGVSDCWSLCRAYYREARGAELPDPPRDDDYWAHGQNLYEDILPTIGFRLITSDPAQAATEAQVGDLVLHTIAASVPNHAGIYLGDDLLLEHLAGRMSQVNIAGQRISKMRGGLWRHDG